MEAVQTRAGEELGGQAHALRLDEHGGSLGQAGPILRAAGLGFALGLLVMIVLTLVSS